jgi:DNA polymerase-1
MLVTRDTFKESLARMRRDGSPWVDTETTGLRPFPGRGRPADKVCGVAVLACDESFYFPIRHSGGDNITDNQRAELMAALNETECQGGHNYGFDIKAMTSDGLKLPKTIVDTMAGAHLYNENDQKGLKYLGDKYLGANSSAESEDLDKLLRMWGLSKDQMWRLPPEYVAAYAEQDVKLTKSLDFWLRDHLYDVSLYDEVSEFTRVLTRMELTGIQLDLEHMAELRREASRNVRRLDVEILKVAGFPLNPASPKQVSEWLRVQDSTEETLSRLNDPRALLILEHRAWNKAINTNYDRYLELADLDGVLHCNMRGTGTVTGRLSSSDPNLQAVPRWSVQQRVREVFIARPGKTFLELDYSQAELRMLAHYTGDRNQIQGFMDGVDAHSTTAKALGIERQLAKVINLAVNYGAGAQKLADQLNVPFGVARKHLENYHKNFPKTRETASLAARLAEQRGFVRGPSGRRRHLGGKDAPVKDALQNLCQLGVACMVRKLMIEVERTIPQDQASQVLQVHDSILLEVDPKAVKETYSAVRKMAIDQPWSSAPFEVDGKVGERWGLMEKYNG